MIMYYYIRNYYLSTSIYEHFTLTNVSNRYMLKAGTPFQGIPAAACAAQPDPPADPGRLAGSCKYDPPNTDKYM